MIDEVIVNRVTQSSLITLDLSDFYPNENEIVHLDIKPFLYKELMLKENDFRQYISELNLELYNQKYVRLFCSSDAIIPIWAYMLIVTKLSDVCKAIFYNTNADIEQQILLYNIENFNVENIMGKPVVIKGCGNNNIKERAYVAITQKILPYAKTIMYGEPCSTVPIYKKKK